MNERDKARLFSETVDRMLEGHKEIPEELGEMGEVMVVAARLMERQGEPAPRFKDKLEKVLRRQWAAEYRSLRQPQASWWRRPFPSGRAPSGRSLAGLAGARRWALTGALIALLLAGAMAVIPPEIRAETAHLVRASVEIVLERVGVREVGRLPQALWVPPEARQVVEVDSLAEAQSQVGFKIRVPTYVPPGLKLKSIEVWERSTIRSVVLYYHYSDEVYSPHDHRHLYVEEYQLPASMGRSLVQGDVAPGVVERLTVQGCPALWYPGAWRETGAWSKSGWGTLIWEEGDLGFSISGTPPKAEMIQVAESLIGD